MEIWLDTIDFDLISLAVKADLISGVTTNPSILAKTQDVPGTLKRLLDLQPGPVAVQVTSPDVEGMVEDGLRIFEFSNRFVVKVPVHKNGCQAIAQLRQEGIPVLGTGILFPSQALLAANYNAAYISPYFSHMGDLGNSCEALEIMNDMLQDSSTKMLAASLRHLEDIIFCAQLGIHGVTIKPDLFYKLIADQPALEKFSHKFLSEWEQAHGKTSIGTFLQS